MLGRWWRCAPLLIIAFGAASTTSAQAFSLPNLRAELAQLARKIEQMSKQEGELIVENEKLAEDISESKRRLQRGESLLLERQLQGDLRISRERSNQLQALDDSIHVLAEQSLAKQRELVHTLEMEIERLTHEAKISEEVGTRDQVLSRVLQLQKEMETHRAQVEEESDALLLSLKVEISATEGPDEIEQKLTVLKDQQDLVRAKIEQLDRQIEDTEKTIALQRNMLALLRDIGRGEEDEFDLDRNLNMAGLEDAIADADAAVNGKRIEKESWLIRERSLIVKAQEFSREIERILEGK